jgi:HTH-type transcriptional regulator/antitoxin HipB
MTDTSSGVSSSLALIGRAVRRQRRVLGLTQAELAGICGVGVRFVSELEAGKPGLEIGRAVHVMQHLGLELRVYFRDGSASTDENPVPA